MQLHKETSYHCTGSQEVCHHQLILGCWTSKTRIISSAFPGVLQEQTVLLKPQMQQWSACGATVDPQSWMADFCPLS